MLRLMYLEHIHGTTRVTELIAQWNETDRQKDEVRQIFEETEVGWRLAA